MSHPTTSATTHPFTREDPIQALRRGTQRSMVVGQESNFPSFDGEELDDS